jgi:hypothetical protein
MLAMRIALTVFFGLCATSQTYAQSIAGGRAEPSGGKVLISFNDRNVYRRTPEDAPAMGSGREDFAVHLACYDFSDCKARIPDLYSALAVRRLSSHPCARAYARISVLGGDFGAGKTSENYEVDFAGTCIVFGGQHFKIRKSIFKILSRPLTNW